MATKGGPGKHYRKGITLLDVVQRFNRKGRGMVHRPALAGRRDLPVLRQ